MDHGSMCLCWGKGSRRKGERQLCTSLASKGSIPWTWQMLTGRAACSRVWKRSEAVSDLKVHHTESGHLHFVTIIIIITFPSSEPQNLSLGFLCQVSLLPAASRAAPQGAFTSPAAAFPHSPNHLGWQSPLSSSSPTIL